MRTIAIAGSAAALALCAALAFEIDAGSSAVAQTTAPADNSAAGATPAPANSTQAAAAISGEQAFNTECGACHMAYPPVLLPARSWQAITANLADHFGEDASLDPETTQKISEYLVANAAETNGQAQAILRGVAPDQVPLRITEMLWWRRAHHEVPDAAFTRPEVVSKSNCLACHRNGASGEAEDN